MAIQLKSQTPISLENAYEKAFKNNLNLKNGKLQIDYQEKIKKSYAVVEPLHISGEIGQIASAYTDNKFSVNQTLRLPGFYNSQKQVLIEEWKSSVLNVDIQKWQLKREIALIYNELNYQNEKQKLLLKADSIYTNFHTFLIDLFFFYSADGIENIGASSPNIIALPCEHMRF